MSPLPASLPHPRTIARLVVAFALLLVASRAGAGDPRLAAGPVDVTHRAHDREVVAEEKIRELIQKHNVTWKDGRVVQDENQARMTREFLEWDERVRRERGGSSARDAYMDEVLRRAGVSGAADKGTGPGHPDYRGDDGDRDLQVKSREELKRIEEVLAADGQRVVPGRNRITAGSQRVMVWGPKEPVPLSDLLDPEVFHNPDDPSVAQVVKKIAALAGKPLPADPAERAALVQEIAKAGVKARKALGADGAKVFTTGPEQDAIDALKPGADRRGRVVPVGATPEEEAAAIERWRTDRLADLRKAVLAEHAARNASLADLNQKVGDLERRVTTAKESGNAAAHQEATSALEAAKAARRGLESRMRADRLTLHMMAKQHPEAAGLLTLPPDVQPRAWREAARDLFGPRRSPTSGADRVLSGCAAATAAVSGYTREVEDARREGREFSRWRASAWTAAYNSRLTRFVVGVSDQLDANRGYVRDLVRQRAEEDPNGGWASDLAIAAKGFGSLAAGVSLEVAKALPAAVGDAVFTVVGGWGVYVSGVELADARADLERTRWTNYVHDTGTVERFTSGVGGDLLGDLRSLAENANALSREFERIRSAGRLLEGELPRMQERIGMSLEAVIVLGGATSNATETGLPEGLDAATLLSRIGEVTKDALAIEAEADRVLEGRRAGQVAPEALHAAREDLERRFAEVDGRRQAVLQSLNHLASLATDRTTVLATHDQAEAAVGTLRGAAVTARDLVRRWTNTAAALAKTRKQFDELESILRSRTEFFMDPTRLDVREKSRAEVVALRNAIPTIRGRLPGSPPVEGGPRDLTRLADSIDLMARDLDVPPVPGPNPAAESRAAAARAVLAKVEKPAAEMDEAMLRAREALDRLEIVVESLGLLQPKSIPPEAPPPPTAGLDLETVTWREIAAALTTRDSDPAGREVLGFRRVPEGKGSPAQQDEAWMRGYVRPLLDTTIPAWFDADGDGKRGRDEPLRDLPLRAWYELVYSFGNTHSAASYDPDGTHRDARKDVEDGMKREGVSTSLGIGDVSAGGIRPYAGGERWTGLVAVGPLDLTAHVELVVQIGDQMDRPSRQGALTWAAPHIRPGDPAHYAALVQRLWADVPAMMTEAMRRGLKDAEALRAHSFSHYWWDTQVLRPDFAGWGEPDAERRRGIGMSTDHWYYRGGKFTNDSHVSVGFRSHFGELDRSWKTTIEKALAEAAAGGGTTHKEPRIGVNLPGTDGAWLWRWTNHVGGKDPYYVASDHLVFVKRNVVVSMWMRDRLLPRPETSILSYASAVVQTMDARPPSFRGAGGR